MPLPYEVYCTYEIPRIKGVKDPDKFVHDLIQALNPNLRISQNREFFEIYPWDAYNMLMAVAKLHNRSEKVVRNTDNTSGENDSNDVDYSVETLYPDCNNSNSLYSRLKTLILEIDGSLEEIPRKNYVTYKLDKKNVFSLWPHDGWIEVVLNAKLGTISDTHELIYDISNRKWTSEQYAMKFSDNVDIGGVKDILLQTYNLKK